MPRRQNVPSDWCAFYRTCDVCGTDWHLSEGPECPVCEARAERARERTELAEISELKGLLAGVKGCSDA